MNYGMHYEKLIEKRRLEKPEGYTEICPHCGISGNGTGALKRWHFDKCKKRAI